MKPGDRVRLTFAGSDKHVAGTVALVSGGVGDDHGRPLLVDLDEPIALTAKPGEGPHGVGGMFVTNAIPIVRVREGGGLMEAFTGIAVEIRPDTEGAR